VYLDAARKGRTTGEEQKCRDDAAATINDFNDFNLGNRFDAGTKRLTQTATAPA
jgi:hypothetical protein